MSIHFLHSSASGMVAAMFLTSMGLVAGLASAGATDSNPIELLRLVSTLRAENLQRLATWQGLATLTSETKTGESAVLSRLGADFVYDSTSESAAWNVTVAERKYGEQVPESVSPDNPEIYGGIVTEQFFYRYAPGEVKNDGEKWNTLVILPREGQKIEGFSTDFHPTWFLGCYGQDVDKDISYRLTTYEQPNNESVEESITRQDDIVVWEKRTATALNRWEFDVSKSGAFVRYHGKDEKCTEQFVWQYGEYDGVWLPESLAFDNSRETTDGTRSVAVRVVFVENRVNEPLEDDEFSINRFGMKPGTLVSDNVAGISYRYGEPNTAGISNAVGTLAEANVDETVAADSLNVSASEDSSDAAPSSVKEDEMDGLSNRRLIFVLPFAILVAVAVVFLMSRRMTITK